MKYCISVNFMGRFALFFGGGGGENLEDDVLMINYCCHDRKCLNFLEHLWNLIAPIYVKKIDEQLESLVDMNTTLINGTTEY